MSFIGENATQLRFGLILPSICGWPRSGLLKRFFFPFSYVEDKAEVLKVLYIHVTLNIQNNNFMHSSRMYIITCFLIVPSFQRIQSYILRYWLLIYVFNSRNPQCNPHWTKEDRYHQQRIQTDRAVCRIWEVLDYKLCSV